MRQDLEDVIVSAVISLAGLALAISFWLIAWLYAAAAGEAPSDALAVFFGIAAAFFLALAMFMTISVLAPIAKWLRR